MNTHSRYRRIGETDDDVPVIEECSGCFDANCKACRPDEPPVMGGLNYYVTGTPEPPKALHYSKGKPDLSQLVPSVLNEEAAVYSYGARKYFRDNWMAGTEWHEFYSSMLRHSYAFWSGEIYDDCDGSAGCLNIDRSWMNRQMRTFNAINGVEGETWCPKHSGLHHLAHVRWNAATLFFYERNELGTDDRPKFPQKIALKHIDPTVYTGESH